ncbi:uncharacterized protein LOC128876923 [Hylaeus volcanicus]|uniref:uncharacterized protein LOC128876923 n=1 Tax=Hylaeus volcanicus TaxID=313075 RepID=UPI0023B85E50|nr:uncharacterized protein LOC128876923 [Hylaeus volcanicus]XP_053979726.1 uncharacterized protein LOC128876923 [Hylaeus volcanicus]XP_053979727.1 uncharacterized protein LOC128876923 [Hylaeus volcanicus]XP_053979728.1 uncharacterized protein LOC128876923 [Hylaeus volcanicus]XP_053979729.1 uncharacterized protein LOC128876923 [Hylaeus volcanicus]
MNSSKIQKMIKLATQCQQNYYEYLPDWLQYNYNEEKYIMENIQFALCGPPVNAEGNELVNKKDIDKKTHESVTAVYKQIIEYGREDNNNPIYVGIIYNVIFPDKLKSNNNESTEMIDEIWAVPVFKIKRKMNTIWYIDNSGRIYQSWNDYLSNNTLPKTVMIVPKNGFYQHDPHYKITKQSSVVWTEMLQSPACSVKTKFLNVIDTATSALSLTTAATLGVTALVTPVGPVLAGAGLITCGVNGLWTIGRSSQQLVDRHLHKESISPINKNALPAWLGLTGTALALGANSGAMFVSKAIEKGNHISNVTKVVYNSVVISNLTVNGIGIAYQGYSLIDKYREKKEVDLFDVMMFSSHVLFFSNTVINSKLSGELIGSSNGTILERCKNALRFKRFREEFNKMMGSSESNDIICPVVTVTNIVDFRNIFKDLIIFKNGKIVVGGVELVDPIQLAEHLLKVGKIGLDLVQSNPRVYQKTLLELKNLLSRLLNNFYSDEQTTSTQPTPNAKSNNVDSFNDILADVKTVNNPTNTLKRVFNIALVVLRYCNDPKMFLCDAVHFVWEYCKANLTGFRINACSTLRTNVSNNALAEIVEFIFDVIDVLSYELYLAFYSYVSNKEICM